MKIVKEVKQRLQSGDGYNETMRQVALNLEDLGIGETLSARSIRAIYEKYREGQNPFLSLFSVENSVH